MFFFIWPLNVIIYMLGLEKVSWLQDEASGCLIGQWIFFVQKESVMAAQWIFVLGLTFHYINWILCRLFQQDLVNSSK